MIDQINNTAVIDGMFLEFEAKVSVNPFRQIYVEIDLSKTNNGQISSLSNLPFEHSTFLFINGAMTEFTTTGFINDIKDSLQKLENPRNLKFFDTLKIAIEKELKEQFPEDYI